MQTPSSPKSTKPPNWIFTATFSPISPKIEFFSIFFPPSPKIHEQAPPSPLQHSLCFPPKPCPCSPTLPLLPHPTPISATLHPSLFLSAKTVLHPVFDRAVQRETERETERLGGWSVVEWSAWHTISDLRTVEDSRGREEEDLVQPQPRFYENW